MYLDNRDNNKNTLTEFNGYTKLDINKVKSMILCFAEDVVLKTKLLQEMFYADFLYYKKIGKSITGLEYAKLNFGPVPNNYEKIINNMVKDGFIDYEIEFNSIYESHNILSIMNFEEEIFSKDELETIRKVKDFFKDFNSSKIVNFSHEEKAFIEPDFFDKISYEYAFDIERDIL